MRKRDIRFTPKMPTDRLLAKLLDNDVSQPTGRALRWLIESGDFAGLIKDVRQLGLDVEFGFLVFVRSLRNERCLAHGLDCNRLGFPRRARSV